MNWNRVLRGGMLLVVSLALALGAWGVMPVPGALAAPVEDDVVINEFSVNPATGKEYVELLVVKPGGVDMQGWTLSDVGTRAGATAATEGDVTLPALAAYLSLVPQGTYVVIEFTTPAVNTSSLSEDLSLTDGNNRLIIKTTTTGVTTAGTIDNATNDNLQLYAGTRAAGTLIDQVLCGTNTSYIVGATWGDNNGTTTADNVNGGTALPSGSAIRFVPTANSLAGFQDNDTGARFTVDSTSYGTPGSTNTGVSDSAVTNPVYASGTVDVGSYTGVTISGSVNAGGDITVYHNGLTVNVGAQFDMVTYALALTDGGILTNNGAISQTKPVSGNSDVAFFNTGGYGGVIINANNADLGSTVVAIKGNQICNQGDELVHRCFNISPANTTNRDATITFYFADGELNGSTCDAMAAYHWSGAAWDFLMRDSTYGVDGYDCTSNPRSMRVIGVTDFSPFGLTSNSDPGPTAVSLSAFRVASGIAAFPVAAILMMGMTVFAAWVWRRRR